MEESKRIQAAAAVAAIVALVFFSIEYASRPASKASAGPGWFSRSSPFGSAPSAEPSPAYARPASPELAPPEPMMTNAAKRLFSSPTSAGSSGGLAGADVPAPPDAPKGPASSANPSRLSGSASMDGGGGGSAPSAGGGSGPPALRIGGAPDAASGAGGDPFAASGSGNEARRGVSKPGVKVARAPGGGIESSGTTGGGAAATASAGAAAPAASAGAAGAGGGGGESGQLSAASSAGGGDPGGGGGGGGGGKGGLGGALPDAKPKQSGKKPAGMDLNGGGPAAGAGAAGGSINGPVGAGAPGAGAILGEPQVDTGKITTGGLFRLDRNAPPSVRSQGQVAPDGATNVVSFTAKMVAGPPAAAEAAKPKTALVYPGGESLDAEAVPFIVLPSDFQNVHPDVKLGDYVAVTYGPKTLYAIVGDQGPAGVVGGASPALLTGLGVDAESGVGGNVRYRIIAGSKDAAPPADAAEVQARGKRIFARARIPVR